MARRAARILFAIALALGPGGASFAQTVLVKAETLTLREKPDPKGEKVQALFTFEPVEIQKTEKEWAQVKASTGKVGWVLSSYLTKTPFISIKSAKAPVKVEDGDNKETVLELPRTYPLRVLKRKESGWLKIVDCDGDAGWLFEKHASLDNYVITHQPKPCNIRKGPSTDTEVVFTCEQGNILKALEEKDGWIHVKHPDGDEGWVSGKIVFGWLDKTGAGGKFGAPAPSAEAPAKNAPDAKPETPKKPTPKPTPKPTAPKSAPSKKSGAKRSTAKKKG